MKKALLIFAVLCAGAAHADVDCTNNVFREARIQAHNVGSSAVRLRLQDSHTGLELQEAVLGKEKFARWIAADLTLSGCRLTGKLLRCNAARAKARLALKVYTGGREEPVVHDVVVKDVAVSMSLRSSGEPVKFGDKPVTISFDTLAVDASMQVIFRGKEYPFAYHVEFMKEGGLGGTCN